MRLVVTQAAPGGGLNTTVIETAPGGSWVCAPSPIVFNHLFDGETYNASGEQAGWDAPGFRPVTPWVPAPPRAPNVSAITTAGAPMRVMADARPTAVVPRTSSAPVISGGAFLKSTVSPDVWWVANTSDSRNYVTQCSPCAGVDACAALHIVPAAVINALSVGPNFTCAMLPRVSTTYYRFDLGRNMAGYCTLELPGGAVPGTAVTLAHGEILNDAGDVDNTFGASVPPRTCDVNVINCACICCVCCCRGWLLLIVVMRRRR